VIVPVGDGCILGGQWKGFKELKLIGETGSLPKMLAVQAEGCNPVVDAFRESRDISLSKPSTIADSIRVGKPRNWRKALRSLQESGGNAVSVSDEEIIKAMLLLGAKTGIFAEPAGAAGVAGLARAIEAGLVASDEVVVVLVTGSGLKDPESLSGYLEVSDVEPSIGAVEKLL
jgi:threonine synthase